MYQWRWNGFSKIGWRWSQEACFNEGFCCIFQWFIGEIYSFSNWENDVIVDFNSKKEAQDFLMCSKYFWNAHLSIWSLEIESFFNLLWERMAKPPSNYCMKNIENQPYNVFIWVSHSLQKKLYNSNLWQYKATDLEFWIRFICFTFLSLCHLVFYTNLISVLRLSKWRVDVIRNTLFHVLRILATQIVCKLF